MCEVSAYCNCDWPTFTVWGSDLPIRGPYQLAEVLATVPRGERARFSVCEDDGFAQSNYIGLTQRHRVRDAVRRVGLDPDEFGCLKEER